jgi:hypothetical protein
MEGDNAEMRHYLARHSRCIRAVFMHYGELSSCLSTLGIDVNSTIYSILPIPLISWTLYELSFHHSLASSGIDAGVSRELLHCHKVHPVTQSRIASSVPFVAYTVRSLRP